MRYFFNKMDGGVDLDMVGTECENLHAARHEAILFAAESIRENPEFLWHAGELRIEVVNERHLLVTTIVIQSIDATDPVSILERH